MTTTQPRKFRCKIDNAGSASLAFICIPFDVKKVFGKARAPVKLTINDFTYRTTICVMGGKYCVPLRKSNREGAGVKAGDVVQVSVVPDFEPRTVEVPADLKKFLQTSKAWGHFDGLSYTHKKEFVDWITGAKKDETREARKQKMIRMLKKREHL
ncbi:MAG TPA: YdeI/OmpD-associated family protein [Candidatus Angelobacter sp.]